MKQNKIIVSELVAELIKDFEQRKNDRRQYELQWQLNIDFLCGNQNNYISAFNMVAAAGRQYWWQEREVFNHIAPLIESRLAKLSKHRPVVCLAPASNDEKDIVRADVAKKIIKAAAQKTNLEALGWTANMWSEICGTSFYKVTWDNNAGRLVGEIRENKKIENTKEGSVYEGDISIMVAIPFEIYPDNLSASSIEELSSIIHAKAYKTAQIKEIWGVDVEGSDVDVFNFTNRTPGRTVLTDAAMVIERYEMPTSAHPKGRLVIVAGNKLLYLGELPYENASGGKRGLPFIRQVSESVPGSFFGRSVIERAIPVQRAYNNIKNRKAEFLARLACGVLSVEDGSVDIESLENDGLAPGKVIIYRQGMNAPQFVSPGSVPSELEREEERLLNELSNITGNADFTRNAQIANMSGLALSILTEQDNIRLNRTLTEIMQAHASVAAHTLRLYRQFAGNQRIERLTNNQTADNRNSVDIFYWSASDINSDEVTAVSSSDLADTPSGKRMIILELLKAGLLQDNSGKISPHLRERILRNINLNELI